MRNLMSLKLAGIGVFVGQDEVLLCLDDEPKTVGMLAQKVNIRPSTASKLIDKLSEKGLVSRVAQTDDQRKITVRLTQRGEEKVRLIRGIYAEMNRDLIGASEEAGMGVNAEHLHRILAEITRALARHR